ncbi:MAG: hypothetical protein GC193_12000 [Cryomorphaceae bacterium]|nr:hypothetical protein [Cryomorphaceae bacterium]
MRFARVRALSSLSQIALDSLSQASSINPHSYRVPAMPSEIVYPFEYSAGAGLWQLMSVCRHLTGCLPVSRELLQIFTNGISHCLAGIATVGNEKPQEN